MTVHVHSVRWWFNVQPSRTFRRALRKIQKGKRSPMPALLCMQTTFYPTNLCVTSQTEVEQKNPFLPPSPLLLRFPPSLIPNEETRRREGPLLHYSTYGGWHPCSTSLGFSFCSPMPPSSLLLLFLRLRLFGLSAPAGAVSVHTLLLSICAMLSGYK